MAFDQAFKLNTSPERRPTTPLGGGGGRGGGGGGGGWGRQAEDMEPPPKRARLDSPLTTALQQVLAVNEYDTFKARIQSILVARIRAHPLYEFARRFVGGTGRPNQIDEMTLFDTAEGQKLIDALLTITKSKAQIANLRDQARLELPRLLQAENHQRRARTATRQQQRQRAADEASAETNDLTLRVRTLSEQLANMMGVLERQQLAQSNLKRLVESPPIESLRAWWKPKNTRMVSASKEAIALQLFADNLSGIEPKTIAAIISNQQFGLSMPTADVDTIINACVTYTGLKRPASPSPTSDNESLYEHAYTIRMHVIRAFLKAFLVDMLCDIPLGAQETTAWIVSAPIFSSFNYALFAYLVMLPWRSASKQGTKVLMKSIMDQSTMFQLLLSKNTLATADPLGYIFGVPSEKVAVGTGGGGGRGSVKKSPRGTDAHYSTDASSTATSAPVSPSPTDKTSKAPLFRGKKTATPVVTYLDDVKTSIPETAALFPWLDMMRSHGANEKWSQGESAVDTAMYGMCLQEALINLLRNKGADYFLDILLKGVDGRKFIDNVLKRLARLIGEGNAFTKLNNPATRNKKRTEVVLNPTFQAQLLHNVTKAWSDVPGTPLITLDAAARGELDRFLQSLVADHYKWVDAMAEIIKDEGSAAVENNVVFKAPTQLLPNATAASKDPLVDRPLATPAPGWFTTINDELNNHLTGASTRVTNVPLELRSHWSDHPSTAPSHATANARVWIDDLINAIEQAQRVIDADIQRTQISIAEAHTTLATARQDLERSQRTPRPTQNPPFLDDEEEEEEEEEEAEGDFMILEHGASPHAEQEAAASEQLREMIDKATKELEELETRLANGMRLLNQASNLFRERADWLQAMESAFRWLDGMSPEAHSWCADVGSAQRLASTQNVTALVSFAGLARNFANTNQESNGGGVYQQAIYYGHNMRRAGDYAGALLQMSPAEALSPAGGGFVHEHLL